MTREKIVAVARLTAWIALLLVLGRVTLALGSRSLTIPLSSLDDLHRWTDETDPADMAAALLRLAALAMIGYLLAATALAVVSDLIHARGLTAVTRRVTPALVRRLATGGGGLGLALGSIVGTAPSPHLPANSAPEPTALVAPDRPSARMTRLDDNADSATMTRLTDAPPDTATMTREEPPLAAHTLPGPAPPAAAYTRAPDGDGSAGTWTVEPGDSFWSIAEDVVTPTAGPTPTERQIARYWRRLIDANRQRLADPANPDLLLPGQRLQLPPPDT